MGRHTACRAGFIVTLAALFGAPACSSESTNESLALDLIDDAISAVDDHFSRNSDFYEINATTDGVNLFVSTTIDGSTPGVIQARYTAQQGLVVADEATPSEGSVFSGDDVDFDSSTVIERAIEELDSARPRVFIVTAATDTSGSSNATGAVYRLVMESRRGGRLIVFLAPDGTILGSDFLD